MQPLNNSERPVKDARTGFTQAGYRSASRSRAQNDDLLGQGVDSH